MKKCPERSNIILFERISPELVSKLIHDIGRLIHSGVSEADLLINCKGGSVASALNLCDVLVASDIKWRGVVVADCMSSAVTVLQTCQERKALPNSCFLVHNTTRKFEIWLDKSHPLEYFQAKLADDYRQTSAMDDRNEKLLTAHIKPASLEEFKRLYATGEHFFPEEALEVGLIDEIVTRA